MRDYEILRKELPGDNEVAESLLRAQESLRLTRGEPSGIDRVRATEYSCGNISKLDSIFHMLFLLEIRVGKMDGSVTQNGLGLKRINILLLVVTGWVGFNLPGCIFCPQDMMLYL